MIKFCSIVSAVCIVVSVVLTGRTAHAGVGTEGTFGQITGGKHPRAQAALNAAEDQLLAYASQGGTVRGASGPLMQALMNSDDMIASAWVIHFEDLYRDLVIEVGTEPTNEELILLEKLWTLKNEIGAHADRIMGDYPPGQEPPKKDPDKPPEPEKKPWELQGISVAEWICRTHDKHCAKQYGDYIKAENDYYSVIGPAGQAARNLDTAEKEWHVQRLLLSVSVKNWNSWGQTLKELGEADTPEIQKTRDAKTNQLRTELTDARGALRNATENLQRARAAARKTRQGIGPAAVAFKAATEAYNKCMYENLGNAPVRDRIRPGGGDSRNIYNGDDDTGDGTDAGLPPPGGTGTGTGKGGGAKLGEFR